MPCPKHRAYYRGVVDAAVQDYSAAKQCRCADGYGEIGPFPCPSDDVVLVVVHENATHAANRQSTEVDSEGWNISAQSAFSSHYRTDGVSGPESIVDEA